MPSSATQLDHDLIDDILSFLGQAAGRPPDLRLLDDLVAAYTRYVPWESASRIAKKARIMNETGSAAGQECARWPAEFWRDALERGTGGTCFESNYAFFALLTELGFTGYLTVNDMDAVIGCHSAIRLSISGHPWLADVGYPIYVPLPLDPAQATGRQSPFHRYNVWPAKANTYVIGRDRHLQPYIFTMIDRAVSETIYGHVLAGDYGQEGLFLDQVIVNKVVDGYNCRFNAAERPFKLERYRTGHKDSRLLDDDPAGEVARFFGLNEPLLRQAFQATGVT